jgi:probable phosphoglycerate mutase
MGELVLARHGATEWSRNGRHTGRTDLPLLDDGREDAKRLQAPLAQRSFEKVLSSPLTRALDTCKLAGLGDRVELTDQLLEWDYGDYEGITTADICKDRPGWNLWTGGCPGGESASEVGARMDSLIAELTEIDGDVALFGHGHALRVLATRWIGLPPENGALFVLSTGTLSVLGSEHEWHAFRTWNAPVGDSG